MPIESANELVDLNSFHLAGIIPLAGQPLDFNFPWHDAMLPIAPNYLAIERAVLECATAGCETIWVICPSDMQPLLKSKLGEMVQDPVWISRKHDVYPSTSRREIPIYYVEMHPRDQNRRDSMVWSILYGAKVAKKVCNSLSQWLVPNKYYVTFPYAVYPSQHLRKYRKEISNHGNFFLLTDSGESVLDGNYIGFAFQAQELGKLIKYFWHKQTGKHDPTQPVRERREGKYITKLLPEELRYSGRFFKIEDIFKELDPQVPTFKVEMEWYYDISCWENFCTYLSSEERKKMLRPKLQFFNNKKWNKIGEDEENS
jgi:hypothetical protein|tara:strand:- start:11814 stop:12755 length:942 start_codon:yes stop_codon:yes gene_type:complete